MQLFTNDVQTTNGLFRGVLFSSLELNEVYRLRYMWGDSRKFPVQQPGTQATRRTREQCQVENVNDSKNREKNICSPPPCTERALPLSLASYNTDPPTAWLPYTGESEIRRDLNACQALSLHLRHPAADSGKQLLNCRFLQAFQNYADSAQEFQPKNRETGNSHLKFWVSDCKQKSTTILKLCGSYTR